MGNLCIDAFLTAFPTGIERLSAVHAHGSRVIAVTHGPCVFVGVKIR